MCLKEVDVALLKLYAECDSSDLVTSIMTCCSHLSDAGIADCVDWLYKCSRYHAVGLLHHFHGDDAAALDVWTRCVFYAHNIECHGENMLITTAR